MPLSDYGDFDKNHWTWEVFSDTYACSAAVRWASKFPTFEAAWAACDDASWLVWWVSYLNSFNYPPAVVAMDVLNDIAAYDGCMCDHCMTDDMLAWYQNIRTRGAEFAISAKEADRRRIAAQSAPALPPAPAPTVSETSPEPPGNVGTPPDASPPPGPGSVPDASREGTLSPTPAAPPPYDWMKAIRDSDACDDAVEFASTCRSWEEVWRQCPQEDWITWWLYTLQGRDHAAAKAAMREARSIRSQYNLSIGAQESAYYDHLQQWYASIRNRADEFHPQTVDWNHPGPEEDV